MAEDNLKIKISLDAQADIGKRIGQITKALQNLNNQANNYNFKQFAEGIAKIGHAADSLKDLSKTAKSLKTLGDSLKDIAQYGMSAANGLQAINEASANLDKSGIVSFGNAIKQVANFLPKLTSAKTRNFKSFAENTRSALEELGMYDNKQFGKGVTDSVRKLKQIGEGMSAIQEGGLSMRQVNANIRNLPSALSEFTKFTPKHYDLIASNIKKVAPAIQELGKNGSHINDAAKGLEKLPRTLGSYGSEKFTEGIEGVRGTLGELSNAFKAFDKEEVKGFSPVVKALGSLPQALSPFTEENYSSAIVNINSVLGGLSASINTFQEVNAKSTKFRTSVNSLFNLHKAIEMFATMPKGAEDAIQNIGTVLLGLNKAMQGLETSPVTNLKKLATGLRYLERIGGDESLWGRISAGGDRMKEFIKNVSDLPDNVVQKFSAVGTALEGIANGYGKINQAQKTLNKAQNNPKSTLPFKGTIDHVKNLSKTFESLRSRIARVALNRAIRQGLQLLMNAVKEGVKNLYQWSLLSGNNFVNTMNSLSSGFLYLKNSIGAAISPLLDQLAPALNTVINLVVTLLNAINQLFSILGGAVTWRRAVRQQKDFAKAVGSGAGGAGDLADELERTVLAFDELNKLNDAKDKSGGGGGGSGADLDYGGMFETVPIDEELARILNSDNWFPLGTKISDWVADGLEKIDWATIKDKANRVAGQLATMLNGIFANDRMWTDIGITIGEGINTATTFITKFVYETDWAKLGDDLANVLKTTVKTINWEDVGKSLVAGFKITMSMLHGFVDGMTWEDWDFLGKSIAKGINGAIEAIQWENIIPDMVDLVAGILHSINTAIANINWQEAFAELKKGIKEADWGWLWEEVWQAIKNAMPIITIALSITFVKGVFTLGASVMKEAVAKWIAGQLAANGGLSIPINPTFTGSGSGSGLGLSSILGILGGGLLTGAGLFDLSNINWEDGDNRLRYLKDYLQLVSGGTLIGGSVGGPGGAAVGLIGSAIAGMVAELFKGGQENLQWVNSNKNEVDAYNEILRAISSKKLEDGISTEDMFDIDNELSHWGRALNSSDTFESARKEVVAYAKAVGINVDEILAKYGLLETNTDTTFKKNVPDVLKAGMDSAIKSVSRKTEFNNKGRENIDSFLEGVRNSQPNVETTSTSIGNTVESALALGAKALIWGSDTASSYATGADSQKPTVQGVVDGVAAVVKAGLDASDKSKTWGIDLASAYASGAESTKPNVETVITGIGDAVKTGLDVGTKSRTWGSDTTGQYKTGLESNKTPISTSVDDLIKIIGLLNRSEYAKVWGTAIPTNLSSGMNDKASLVSTSAGTLQGYLNGINLSGSSWTWGYHLSKNLADGINYGSSLVSTAATGVATGIANLLGHSIPKEGPLTAELEWMPHMMENLANGIRTNAWRVENEMSNVASSMVLPSSSFNIEDDAEYGLSSALNGLALDTSSETPIVVYIGEDKLDSVIAKSQGRMNVRSGGR